MSRSFGKRHGIAGRFGPVGVSALLLLGGIPAGSVAHAAPAFFPVRSGQVPLARGVLREAIPVTPNLAASDFTSTDQVIVSWDDAGSSRLAPGIGAQPARVDRVTAAAGEQAAWLRTLAVGGDVYRLGSRLSPERLAATVAALRAQPGVAFVEPDRIFQADASPPNDPYWTTPAPGQWDLSEGTTPTTYGIDLLGAWDRTLGAGVVVAVLDTGITTHPDLAGQTVAGYDFISDPQVANDGNGRDADPSDPGDWCGSAFSSWHGTHVSGTIAASTNNTIGIAGIAPSARIQPVRVLGKCGGYGSDIADAIVWASGGSVSGVPANPTPARVINMSLGGNGSCGSTYQSAIDGALSRGTVVVVAAGNSNADASGFTPANCAGVITVAATGRNGSRASFSNYGSVVEIAAPGVSLWSTLNDGATVPGNPAYAQYSGTSMATPHVAGVAALMLAANPALTPAQVVARMQLTAHQFASSGCPEGCGSGIVDAAMAVAASLTPTVTSITPANGPTGGGTTVTIAGTGFTGATAVHFGATSAASFGVSSGTQMSAVSPVGTGTADITVTGPGGTSATSPADQFTYVAGSVVATCDQAHLASAVATGGMVTFTCSGTISLTSTIQVALPTVLDATGRTVVIDGGGTAALFSGQAASLGVVGLTLRNGHGGTGAAISLAGDVTATGSTFYNNTTPDGDGGAINAGSVIVTNSTFVGNSTSGLGGAIVARTGITATNSTFLDNVGNGTIELDSGPAVFRNTILSGGGPNCFLGYLGASTLTDAGGNFSTDGSCGFTQASSHNSVGVTTLHLGQLADNGGSTQTIALGVGSVAIDTGIACPPPATDQRGTSRPQGAHCDSGAYEYAGLGFLRVTTNPALPAQISLNGAIADSWGLNWLEVAPGSYTVHFSHVDGYTEPADQVVVVTAGATATLAGGFTQRGSLRVVTSPPLAGQVSVDGVPRNDWGMWTDLPTGFHAVCFGLVAGYTAPACQDVTVNAGAPASVTGTYTVGP